jgi:hypothetical protein
MYDTAENIVLTSIYTDTLALGGVRAVSNWRNTCAIARLNAGLEHLARFGPRLAYDRWLGRRPTVTERRALSRALARLEDKGCLVRSGGQRRTTHVRLTRAGTALARMVLERVDDDGEPMFVPIDWPNGTDSEGAR